MDNSQRFDDGDARTMLTVDFSVFAARESSYVATMQALLGNASAASRWRAVAANLSSAVHQHLWDEGRGFYFDRKANGQLSPIEAVSGLLPLWLPDLPHGRLQRLLDAISDPTRFGTKVCAARLHPSILHWPLHASCVERHPFPVRRQVPLPSVARRTPSFSTDMWRGPMWLNTNYHVALALISQNRSSVARDIVRSTLTAVQDSYQAHGVLFEFYDADGTHDPRTLLRKGARTGGVRDYHWTAALTYVMAQMNVAEDR